MKKKLFKKGLAVVLTLALVASVGFYSKGFKSEASNVESYASKVSPELKEKLDNLILNEDDFANEIAKTRKITEANKKTYNFKGKDDVSIYCESHLIDNPKGTMVICPGFSENLYAYDEMTYYFNSMGYSTFGIEHRGNSRSGRLGCDDSQVHVESFEDYVDDMNTFVENIVKVNTNAKDKMYLFSHSMGGMVATRYLERYPSVFPKAVLSAPMHGVNTGNVPTAIAKALSSGAAGTFWPKKYVPGQTPFIADEYTFETACCVSKARFDELAYKPRIENKELQSGGPSYKWLSEAYNMIKKAKKDKKNITASVLLCKVIGDVYVDPKGSDEFAKGMSNIRMSTYKDVKHEIYKSTNDILIEYLYEIFDLYEN